MKENVYLKHSNFPDGHFANRRIVLGLQELFDGDVLPRLAVSASHYKTIAALAHHRNNVVLFHGWRANFVLFTSAPSLVVGVVVCFTSGAASRT